MTDSASANPLAKFAELHGLSFAATAKLPQQGATLTHGNRKVEGAASGELPGGIDGTLAHFTYTYTYTDSDHHTHTETRRFTLVVTQIPESIGFLPYFGFTGSDSKLSPMAGGEDMTGVDLGDADGLKHAHASAYKGTSQNWLAQLLSPALVDWLARSEDDFGFELANGVLCVGRDGYLSDSKGLETVCEDAAHVAGAIRTESLEEVGTDGAESEAAKDPDAVDAQMEAALKELKVDPPADTAAAVGAYSGFVRRSPATFFGALKSAVLITLVLNIPGIAIPILLVASGQYALLAAIEAVLIGLVFFFAFRKRIRDSGKKYAAEAFYRAFAAARELTIEEPLHFAATHAEAKLPFKPDRVFSGPLPGAAGGSLVLAGDGSKRADRIAVVAGPDGPFAEAELKTASPTLSAKDLDGYTKKLIAELLEDLATRPSP